MSNRLSNTDPTDHLFEDFPGTPNFWLASEHLTIDRIALFKRTQHQLLETTGESHPSHVLLIPRLGTGTILIDGNAYPIEPGKALIIHPFQIHAYSNLSPSFLWGYIRFRTPSDNTPSQLQSNLYDFPQKAEQAYQETLKTLNLELSTKTPFSTLPAKIINLLQHLTPAKQTETSPYLKLLKSIHTQVTQNISPPITPDLLAHKLGYSAGYLNNLLKKHAGQSLAKYILAIRLQKAAKLLHFTDTPIGEIADITGFSSPAVFTRAFQRLYKTSPKNLRDNR